MGALHVAFRVPDPRPGDVLHLLGNEIVGLDRGGDRYRLARLWGFVASEVAREVVAREGWDASALSAAGACMHANPPPSAWRLPEVVARMLPHRSAALAGAVGGRPGAYPATWLYDRVAAYPALAGLGVPDPARWRVAAAVPAAEDAAGYVVGAHLRAEAAEIIPDRESPPWLTLDEYRALMRADLVSARPRLVLLTRRVRFDWFDRICAHLLEARDRWPEARGVYKAALNGLIGRMASSGGYERVQLGRGDEIFALANGAYTHCIRLHDARDRSFNASIAHDVVARQRLDIFAMRQRHDVVWWYVDAVALTHELPPNEVGARPGAWRLLSEGESRIVNWQGGVVAGQKKVASVPRAAWEGWLSTA